MNSRSMSRRTFVALSGAISGVMSGVRALGAGKKVPIGLELFSVREALTKDLMGTVRAVAKLGYEVVEFYAPYFEWTPQYAKDIRKLLDDLGIRCNSTHNSPPSFTAEGLRKAIELNQIIGSKNIILASAGRVEGIAGWKALGEQMTKVSETLQPLGMATGFHNHQTEWGGAVGQRPMDVLAANTPREFTLQLDVGTVMEAGADPVAWIHANPGRIRSIHCKDWGGPDRDYRVLFGEGDSPWQKIFEAAESVGGVEYYLIEQEGSRFPELETAERCLATWKKMRA
ncbi:MAG TPA: sugar phosphate isomerase/epimerase [Bryobacteraceae bacterium]|nr:sugar phosphate isomerase/epimerase [Bryobacteraceae bacterium]